MVDSRILIDTLIYSDIFSSPLAEDELYFLLHTNKPLKRQEFSSLLKNSKDLISCKKGFVALKSRDMLVPLRVKNIARFEEKLSLAKRAAFYISFIPTVYFVGLTGSVAAGNPGKDDIDFFIITKRGALFSSRLFIILILSCLGMKRKRVGKNVENKICLNMFCDTIGMSDFINRKNIYVAREIAQMIPLVDRNSTYNKFIEKNRWTRKFIAHVGLRSWPVLNKKKSAFENLIILLEPVCRYISMKVMGMEWKSSAKELHTLFFYPSLIEENIIKKYRAAGGLL